jgi:hypothetical protein
MSWIKTSESLPERKQGAIYSQVPCLVFFRNQITILQFNHEHQCWDDEDGDDYCCDIESVDFWMPLPSAPIVD